MGWFGGLWGGCGFSKILLYKGSSFIKDPLKHEGVGPPSDYPESSWKVFWLVLALLGSDLDDLWRK